MPEIVYYVATSLDGFIAGKNEDISQFIPQGKGVDQYLSDLKSFETVIMGRKTYEFGYQFGLRPGAPAYPHMKHYIFSNNLKLEDLHDSVHVEKIELERVKEIKENANTDIYLCGGGEFAGWLLDHDLIDRLKLKINPIVLGEGISLFGASTQPANWVLTESQAFDDGLIIATYQKRK